MTGTHQQVPFSLRFVQAIYIVLLSLALIANTETARAQQDTRLSTEPLSLVLPDYAKIQSAAHIGDINTQHLSEKGGDRLSIVVRVVSQTTIPS